MKLSAIMPFAVLGIFAVIISISFLNPNITGYVSANVFTQNLDININESQDFLLTSDSKNPFIVTSLRVSGNISGDGIVRIYLDTGKGQTALIYENTEAKRENNGFVSITGRQIESYEQTEAGEMEEGENISLLIRPLKNPLKKEEIGPNNATTVSGVFANKCIETCSMYMYLSKETTYRLVVLMEEGTKVRIENIVYQIEES